MPTSRSHEHDPRRQSLSYLYREEMTVLKGQLLELHPLGGGVSELYIDPVSAVIIRDALERAEHLTELSFIHMVCHTPDSPSSLSPSSEIDELVSYADSPTEFSSHFPSLDDGRLPSISREVKLAKVLEAWIEEVTEDQIIDEYRFEPGDPSAL
jgi:helicase